MKVAKSQLLTVIAVSGGNVSAIARELSVSRTSVRRWLAADRDLAEAMTEARETLLDMAEKQLFVAVHKGSPWAIRFVLSTLGKSRGYSTAVQVEGTLDHVGKVELYLPDNGRDSTEVAA